MRLIALAVGIETGTLLIYLLLGAGAGLVAGLLGVGGGLVIVPVLALVFAKGVAAPAIVMHLAIGTSLATIVFTSVTSVYTHHRHGAVMWPVMRWYAPGIVGGAFVGAYLASVTPSEWLKSLFGVFEILVAVQMASGFKPPAHRQLPGTVGLVSAGSIIGAVSSILGIGGGTMTVPFLVWCNITIHKAVATSAAAGVPIALAGTLGFIVTGAGDPRLPDYTTGFIYWPALAGIAVSSLVFAPLGAVLAHRLPTRRLKQLFALMIGALGVWMLVD